MKDKDINNEMNKLDFLILRKFNHEFISNTKTNVRIIEECDEIFDLYLNSYAALIFDLILCGVNSISIFNLDFSLIVVTIMSTIEGLMRIQKI